MREIEKRASSAPLDQGRRGPSNDVPVPAAVEPDEVITQKQVAKSTHVVIEASEEMSLEIARRLLKIEAQADELFDGIANFNREQLGEMSRAFAGHDVPLAQMLSDAAARQLKVLTS